MIALATLLPVGVVYEDNVLVDELQNKAVRGVAWSMFSQFGRQGMTFIVNIILARLLLPRDFGLVAMILVFAGFATIFAELGLGVSLIQKKDIEEAHLTSVFWVNVGVGLLLMLLFMAMSPLIGAFYQESLLIPMNMVLAVNFFIGGLGIVHRALRIKSLDFKTISIVELIAIAISGTVAITMALNGFGVWSLVVQSLVSTIITVLLFWKMVDWRPGFSFSRRALMDLFDFSINLTGTRVLNYWARNLDNLLIGRVIGSRALGLYGRAYAFVLYPLNNISQAISRVMFPMMSIVQDDKKRVKRLQLKTARAVGLVTFPTMLGLFVVAEPFVIVLLGEKWAEIIPILKIFSLLGMMQSISCLNGNLYLSQGRTDLQFRVSLVLNANIMIAIIIGLQWGVMGVAIAYAAASTISMYPSFRFAGRLVDLACSEYLKNLGGVFGCSAAMAILVSAFSYFLPNHWSHPVTLSIQVSCGVGLYLLFIHLFRVRAYREIKDLIKEQFFSTRPNIVGS